MYEAFFGLRQKPFSLLPDPAFLYLGSKHSMALTMLEYGVVNGALLTVITGEIGSGKTTLVRRLLDQLEGGVTVGLISNTQQSLGDLLKWVLLAYGQDYRGKDRVELYHAFVDFLIQEYAEGRSTLLIIDEAQNLSVEMLEELRLLSNVNADKDRVFQIILAGQPELKRTLARPELEQFAQRIEVDYHLGALNSQETSEYIRHRLSVAGRESELLHPDAVELVHQVTGGIPRLINMVCDGALVYGFAEQRPTIDQGIVADVVRDRQQAGLARFANDTALSPEVSKLRPAKGRG